ncbi:MAG TPA: DUF3224 domain-containing protein [Blastocatellia bacterium]|nr:DUF3224 domain-containing protein [Blastocatellia bacterium]
MTAIQIRVENVDQRNQGDKGVSTRVDATFEVKSWDEKPCDEAEGMGKMVRVQAVYTYQGDIEGEGTWEAIMSYPEGGTTTYFVSLQRFVGRLGGKSGSFMLQGQGTYRADEGAKSEFFVVPGSGTNELSGLVGKGSYLANQPPFTTELSYDFE